MKPLRITIALFLLAAGLKLGAAASNDVSAVIFNEPVFQVLKVYEAFSGKKFAGSNEAKAMKLPVTVKIKKKTKEEALRILEDALASQASIEIVHQQDGSFSARTITPRK